MSVVAVEPVESASSDGRPRWVRWAITAGAACIVGIVALVLAIGYQLGAASRGVTVAEGVAYAGTGQSSVTGADGWIYGVPTGLRWLDSAGSWHDSGRPGCLADGATTHLRFGWVDVTDPDGTGWRQVVWVACPTG